MDLEAKLKKYAVPWDEAMDRLFTKEEQEIMDVQYKLRFAARKIKELREKHNLTQEELAKRAELPRTTISKIESGYQNVSIMKLNQLANAMGMAVEIKLVPLKEFSKRVKAELAASK